MTMVSTDLLEKQVAKELNCMVLPATNEPAGTPLLMLHGWGQSMISLHMMGSLLQRDREIHLIDLPGFGDSDLPEAAKSKEGAWDTRKYAHVIIEYMNGKGLKTANILGHSFGGRVCLQLAAHFPDRIEKVVLMDAAGLKPHRSLAHKLRLFKIKSIGSFIRTTRSLTGEKINKKWHGWFSSKYGSTDYKSASDMKNVLVKTVTEDQAENAKKIKHPTLLIWGENDQATPLDQAHRLKSYIANSELLVLENKGHMPYESLGSHLIVYHLRNWL